MYPNINIKFSVALFLSVLMAAVSGCFDQTQVGVVSGQLKTWHKITLNFHGPETSETASPNPFTDFRLNVTFINGSLRYIVPGYYAADGNAANAANTGAVTGSVWRVNFTPDAPGRWSYQASFRTGKNITVDQSPDTGVPTAFDGAKGSFEVLPADKTGRDFRGKGMLRYIGKRYLQFAETGEYFLKGGADSPENFLAYADFDGTFDTEKLDRDGEAKGDMFIHTYAPHAKDFRQGDPTWKNGKGKNIIGALNYLASAGVNSVYFLTYNLYIRLTHI